MKLMASQEKMRYLLFHRIRDTTAVRVDPGFLLDETKRATSMTFPSPERSRSQFENQRSVL